MRLIERPSIFGSVTYATSLVPSRFARPACHFSSVSFVVTFSSEPIGEGWSTFSNLLRRRRADALGRRIGRHELGIRLLEREELVVEAVELRVRDLRLVEDVVAVEVVVEQVAQLGRALVRPLEDAKELLRRVDDASGSSALEPLARWMPPQVTATRTVPAAFAAWTSNGESPT